MKKRLFVALFAAALSLVPAFAQRSETLLEKGLKFHLGDVRGAEIPGFSDSEWQDVRIPHDWAIYGPFDRDNDLQEVAVKENGETVASWKTGRTGGLPYMGIGWYRTCFDVPEGKAATLVFDGAMSEARVYVNGHEATFRPYGYSSFHFDATPFLNDDGSGNVLAVRLENRPFSSRWYPGAGLYRNVHLLVTGRTHIPVWGTQVTTPFVKDDFASVSVKISVVNEPETALTFCTAIISPDGKTVAEDSRTTRSYAGRPVEQTFTVNAPKLWSPEHPSLYKAVTRILDGDCVLDEYTTVFGIRTLGFIPGKGFFLNGEKRKFRGVCMHHDLGPLGAAVNEAAIRHQLVLLKDMGCDAIRTTHNMPDPILVRLCNEMGFMMMAESFDEWDVAKCENGYHRFFNEWAERDLTDLVRHYRNDPCVVMWSIGNEVPTQESPDGASVVRFLQDICHREDPTRPCTFGINLVPAVYRHGFADALDIPGLNYLTGSYFRMRRETHNRFVLGSETASTVSSRGVYKRCLDLTFGKVDADHQCSAYDTDACDWSNTPDVDFALEDDYEWTMGQFVWTGFDYLGEPSPYDTDAWPNHSSMFGVFDLASLPKDRFWLYRSQWNRDEHTLHLLPHWNWRKGETVPVMVYTDSPSAELFLNGRSLGVKTKAVTATPTDGGRKDTELRKRYRLIWEDVVFEPGVVEAVALDRDGNEVMRTSVRTAGKPHHIELVPDRSCLKADGRDLTYVTVRIVDRDGNLCPHDGRLVKFEVNGEGTFRAVANGDPTCLEPFHVPQMHAFNGMLTAIVLSGEAPGTISLKASASGLVSSKLELRSFAD